MKRLILFATMLSMLFSMMGQEVECVDTLSANPLNGEGIKLGVALCGGSAKGFFASLGRGGREGGLHQRYVDGCDNGHVLCCRLYAPRDSGYSEARADGEGVKDFQTQFQVGWRFVGL